MGWKFHNVRISIAVARSIVQLPSTYRVLRTISISDEYACIDADAVTDNRLSKAKLLPIEFYFGNRHDIVSSCIFAMEICYTTS